MIVVQGIGAISGGTFAAFMLESLKTEPLQFLSVYVGFCILLFITSIFLGEEAEP